MADGELQSLLAKAAAALDGGERVAALEALLAAWRIKRAPQLAALVDAVSRDVARALPPIDGKTLKATHERWLDVAAEERAVDVPRLLAGLAAAVGKRRHDRLERLAARPDDPRVSDALMALIEDCPVTGQDSFPMWTEAFRLLARHADPRVPARLTPMTNRAWQGGFAFRNNMERRVAQALVDAPSPPPLDDDEVRALADLEAQATRWLAAPPPSEAEVRAQAPAARRGGGDHAALFAEVYAHPDDDAPRLVLADRLIEAGDARGELLALQLRQAQLSTAERRRMKALLKQHGAEWLGALRPLVDAKTAVFERGFLAACTPRIRTAKQRATLTQPEWATVHTLVGVHDATLLQTPALAHIRTLDGVDVDGLALLAARSSPLALTSIHVRQLDAARPSTRATFESARGLPALRHLIFGPVRRGGTRAPVDPDTWAWLLDTPLGRQLTQLSLREVPIYAPGLTVGAWLRLLDAHDKIETLDALLYTWHWQLARQPDGWHLTLTPARDARAVWLPAVADSLRDLQPGQLAAMRLRRTLTMSANQAEQVRAIVAERAPLEIVDVQYRLAP